MKKGIIGIVCLVLSLVSPVISAIKDIQFDQRCAGFLKQAADASSVELAERQLNLAIDYVEKVGLTSGYTSVIYKTEDENIDFWYENLKVCQRELAETKGNSTLENTNVLMKLRESLTDNSENGTRLTIPSGIYLYPNNALFMVTNWISLFLFLGSLFLFVIALAEWNAEHEDDDQEEDEEEDDRV